MTVIELFSAGLNMRRKHECVFHAYFSWMLGPTVCPGSVPNSETETQPWPDCCHTAKTGNSKGQRSEVIFLQTQPGSVASLLGLPHWLLLRGWESTCLQNMPDCFSGIGSWHFYKIEGRRERVMINMWKRSAADQSEGQIAAGNRYTGGAQ